MNCAELAKNIHELEDVRDELKVRADYSNDTGLGRRALKKAVAESDTLCDTILESYLDDFEKTYPEISNDWDVVGEMDGDYFSHNLIPLPDGKSIVQKLGATEADDRFLVIGCTDGRWQLCNEIKGLNKITSYFSLSDRRILLEDANGKTTRILTIENEDDKWVVKNEIKDSGFTRTFPGFADIVPLPDGKVAIRKDKKLILHEELGGEWKEHGEVKGDFPDARAATPLPDGRVMVANRGKLTILEKKDEEWAVGEEISGFGHIYSITMLPDGNAMIQTGDHDLVLIKNEDGRWVRDNTLIEEQFGTFLHQNQYGIINRISTFDGEKVLINLQKEGKALSDNLVLGKKDGKWRIERLIDNMIGKLIVRGKNLMLDIREHTLEPIVQNSKKPVQKFKIEGFDGTNGASPLPNGALFVNVYVEPDGARAIILAKTANSLKRNLGAIIAENQI